jgi:hypothetical protein
MDMMERRGRRSIVWRSEADLSGSRAGRSGAPFKVR